MKSNTCVMIKKKWEVNEKSHSSSSESEKKSISSAFQGSLQFFPRQSPQSSHAFKSMFFAWAYIGTAWIVGWKLGLMHLSIVTPTTPLPGKGGGLTGDLNRNSSPWVGILNYTWTNYKTDWSNPDRQPHTNGGDSYGIWHNDFPHWWGIWIFVRSKPHYAPTLSREGGSGGYNW